MFVFSVEGGSYKIGYAGGYCWLVRMAELFFIGVFFTFDEWAETRWYFFKFGISDFFSDGIEVDIVTFENSLCFFLKWVGRFVNFREVLKHDGDCEVENKKRTDYDDQREVKTSEPRRISILHQIHYIRPALQSGALEDSQQRKADIIEVSKAVVEICYVHIFFEINRGS